MGFDDPLSAQEQMLILYEAKLLCLQNLSNIDPESTGTTCASVWENKLSLQGQQIFDFLPWNVQRGILNYQILVEFFSTLLNMLGLIDSDNEVLAQL